LLGVLQLLLVLLQFFVGQFLLLLHLVLQIHHLRRVLVTVVHEIALELARPITALELAEVWSLELAAAELAAAELAAQTARRPNGLPKPPPSRRPQIGRRSRRRRASELAGFPYLVDCRPALPA